MTNIIKYYFLLIKNYLIDNVYLQLINQMLFNFKINKELMFRTGCIVLDQATLVDR